MNEALKNRLHEIELELDNTEKEKHIVEYQFMCDYLNIRTQTVTKKLFAPPNLSKEEAYALGYENVAFNPERNLYGYYKFTEVMSSDFTDDEFAKIKALYLRKRASDEENAALMSKSNKSSKNTNVSAPAVFNSKSFASVFFHIMMYVFWIGGFIASIVLSFERTPVLSGYSVDSETTFNWISLFVYLAVFAFSGFASRSISEVIETQNKISHNTELIAKNTQK